MEAERPHRRRGWRWRPDRRFGGRRDRSNHRRCGRRWRRIGDKLTRTTTTTLTTNRITAEPHCQGSPSVKEGRSPSGSRTALAQRPRSVEFGGGCRNCRVGYPGATVATCYPLVASVFVVSPPLGGVPENTIASEAGSLVDPTCVRREDLGPTRFCQPAYLDSCDWVQKTSRKYMALNRPENCRRSGDGAHARILVKRNRISPLSGSTHCCESCAPRSAHSGAEMHGLQRGDIRVARNSGSHQFTGVWAAARILPRGPVSIDLTEHLKAKNALRPVLRSRLSPPQVDVS